jgi:hypothetical protein
MTMESIQMKKQIKRGMDVASEDFYSGKKDLGMVGFRTIPTE